MKDLVRETEERIALDRRLRDSKRRTLYRPLKVYTAAGDAR